MLDIFKKVLCAPEVLIHEMFTCIPLVTREPGSALMVSFGKTPTKNQ